VICRDGRLTDLMRVWDEMRVKGLVWLGIPVDDYASAVRLFAESLGLDVAFDEANSMELVRRRTATRSSCLALATTISGSAGAVAPGWFPYSKWTTLTKRALTWPDVGSKSSASQSRTGSRPG
jgi:hypothetical protein